MVLLSPDNELREAEGKRNALLGIYAALTVVFAAAVMLLLLSSGLQYLLPMTINILLTLLYGWYSVWFWNVVFRSADCRLRLARSMAKAVPGREYLTWQSEGERRSYRGVLLYEETFSTPDGKMRQIMSPCPLALPQTLLEVTVCAGVLCDWREVSADERL